MPSKNISNKNIALFCSLLKKNNLELVLEKGTELGISEFVPLLSDRSEKKDLDLKRGRKIIKEASEQSGRVIMPNLQEIKNLKDILEGRDRKLVAFHPAGVLLDKKIFSKKDLGILIGPEGGWSEREVELFLEKSVPVYSLGAQILRAETAAIALATLALL